MPLSSRELLTAYTAGFFDGEGCVRIAQQYGGTRLVANLAQKDIRPLEVIQKVFGGSFATGRGVIQLQWWNHRALPLLEAIEPFLIVKQEQVRLAIEFGKLLGRPGVRTADSVRERREQIASEIQQLKLVK